jgi:hypothetical protein
MAQCVGATFAFARAMRLTLAALPLLALTIAPACSSPEPDELAGEADPDGVTDGKGDSPDGAYTYFEISADLRECVYPVCGGYFLDRLNASQTTCHDGSRAAACYTPELDWSESGLTDDAQDQLRVAASRSTDDGVYAIVRGRFAKGTVSADLGRFVVTEAWVAEGEGVSDGVFAKVTQNGVRCIAAPCPSLTERALNASRRADIAEVDFGAGDLSDASISNLLDDTAQPGGIIVSGDRFTVSVSGRTGKGRTATNAYRNLANVNAGAGDCYIGGCAGQVCSDQQGVITTCEWHEEYACYQDATCERQQDGTCGWTPTPELEACLGDQSSEQGI